MTRMKIEDRIGQKFGMLTITVLARRDGTNYLMACECDCGATYDAWLGGLSSGKSWHCGCQFDRDCREPEYVPWREMIRRCCDEESDNYQNYGARGITVADAWQRDFRAFREHVGPRPSSSHSIDRIDVNGNYEPGNVRWATRLEQARNKRTNKIVTIQGVTLNVSAWAELCGISRERMGQRFAKFSMEDAALSYPSAAMYVRLRNDGVPADDARQSAIAAADGKSSLVTHEHLSSKARKAWKTRRQRVSDKQLTKEQPNA